MKSIVADAIRFYYEQDNDAAYIERCHAPLDAVAAEIKRTAAEFSAVVKRDSLSPGPAYNLKADFGSCYHGLFVAEFDTEIFVSRLANIFHVLHGFSVENQHERPVAPTLQGYGNTGYIMQQFDMHEALRERLTARGYTELDLADMEEVIPTLSFLEGVTMFGPQVKVEHALFQDFRGLCQAD